MPTKAEVLERFKQEKDLSPAELRQVVDSLALNLDLNQEIISIEEFIRNPYYSNAGDKVWPAVLRELEEINSGKYVECVLTGSIGSAKTTAALYTQLYQLYYLSCHKSPQSLFGLDPSHEIVIIFQSMKLQQAKEVAYERFKAMVEASPYFQRYFPFDPSLKSQLHFPCRIIVKPVAGTEGATIGQNVIGGLIDEINFMATVADSKRSVDGGEYDQAIALYESIARRRESRFMQAGSIAGMLCLVSSKRFRGQFTDIKEEEAQTNPRIYVYDKRLWDVAPLSLNKFNGETFPIFTGDEHRAPFLIDGDNPEPEDADDLGLVMEIPIEYEHEFKRDMLNALRDIAGVSTTALNPFIVHPEKVVAQFGLHKNVFSSEWCDFKERGLTIYPNRFWRPEEPRLVHIDLAISRDSCGIAVGTITGFAKIRRGDPNEEGETPFEVWPKIRIDGVVEVKPPRGGEIIFEKVRNIIYVMTKLGVNVKWVTMDSFQSTDSRQILSQKGYKTKMVSLDKDTRGYDLAKGAFYDHRIRLPEHAKCQREFLRLERDDDKQKIDHRPSESKDCADAVAGVVYGLTMRRELWHRWKIPTRQMPHPLQNLTGHDDNKQKVRSKNEDTDTRSRLREQSGKKDKRTRRA